MSATSPKRVESMMASVVSGTADNLPQPYQPPPSTATSDDARNTGAPHAGARGSVWRVGIVLVCWEHAIIFKGSYAGQHTANVREACLLLGARR